MSTTLKGITPVLRIFDVDLALAFYQGFLGFREQWRHQFEANLPIYLGLTRDSVQLHLTEHFGDATPGSHLRIEVDDVTAFCDALNEKAYRHSRPSVERQPWGNLEMTIADPFGNRLTFWSPELRP
jgi:catechol 2,3-dioxygenase-like lactoylglutathione lyase family enzyme